MTTKTKTFAAITIGDYVLFTFAAANSEEARRTMGSLKKRSETVTAVRMLRPTDLPYFGGLEPVFEHRGGN